MGLTHEQRQEALHNLIDEMALENKCDRLAYLYDRMEEIKKELDKVNKEYLSRVEADAPYIERHGLAGIIKKLKADYHKLNDEFNLIAGLGEKTHKGITRSMIDKAREYPIENILEVNGKGYTLCPFHADRSPSFYTKGNFGYCFSCGEHADPIKVMMKVQGIGFTEAVKRMQ